MSLRSTKNLGVLAASNETNDGQTEAQEEGGRAAVWNIGGNGRVRQEGERSASITSREVPGTDRVGLARDGSHTETTDVPDVQSRIEGSRHRRRLERVSHASSGERPERVDRSRAERERREGDVLERDRGDARVITRVRAGSNERVGVGSNSGSSADGRGVENRNSVEANGALDRGSAGDVGEGESNEGSGDAE